MHWKRRLFPFYAPLRSALGGRLFEPLEVFHLPEDNLFFPILPKCGASSVKLRLLRRFRPAFDARFPGIHLVDPAPETGGRLRRYFFHYTGDYAAFAAGKRLEFILRDPYARAYSGWLGVTSERNVYYGNTLKSTAPSPFHPAMSFPEYLRWIVRLGDRVADRHFRTQSFYLAFGVAEAVVNIRARTLADFLGQGGPRLNHSRSDLPAEWRARLAAHGGFRHRYAADLALWEDVTGK